MFDSHQKSDLEKTVSHKDFRSQEYESHYLSQHETEFVDVHPVVYASLYYVQIIFVYILHLPINQLVLLRDVGEVVIDGLRVTQYQRMQKLNENELCFIQGQQGQGYAVHYGWEEHPKYKSIEQGFLSH